MVNIGEAIIIRDLADLVKLAKNQNGKNYMKQYIARNIEINGFMLAEVLKVSARKYQLTHIMTEDNSYCIEDDNVFFTADWYDIKALNNAIIVEYYNDFLGTCSELRLHE